MDPTTITLITATISAVGGVIAKGLLDRWQEARRGRMDEAQRKAAEVDKLRRYARRLVEALHATRALALQHGIPMGELPEFPERED